MGIKTVYRDGNTGGLRTSGIDVTGEFDRSAGSVESLCFQATEVVRRAVGVSGRIRSVGHKIFEQAFSSVGAEPLPDVSPLVHAGGEQGPDK